MMDRRDFIKKAGRGLIAGGIVAGGAYLLIKPVGEEKCELDFICKNCKQLKNCSLPEADDFKKKNESSTNKR